MVILKTVSTFMHWLKFKTRSTTCSPLLYRGYWFSLQKSSMLTNSAVASTSSIKNAMSDDMDEKCAKITVSEQNDYDSSTKRHKSQKRKAKDAHRANNHPKKMARFQQDEDYSLHITQYVEKGLRKIKPYIFLFETHAKGRWIGRTLMDVFKKEFRLDTPEYYKTAISGGLITLNGHRVLADTVIRSQDFLQSRVHRHEPPVSGEPLHIIAQNEKFVVINKPSSIPIHPGGKYRHNTIVYLMAKEHGLKGLHTFYRLDRLTSGVFIFARSTEIVKKIHSQMRDRELLKVYLCKVKGEFTSERVECSEPILAVSHKIGVCRVSPDGKQAKTVFQRVSFDGETSIVKCTPMTGRMHQIRVHMQYLGFPVLNDPLYTGPAWGPDQGKAGKIPFATNEELVAELTKLHNQEQEGARQKAPQSDKLSLPQPSEEAASKGTSVPEYEAPIRTTADEQSALNSKKVAEQIADSSVDDSNKQDNDFVNRTCEQEKVNLPCDNKVQDKYPASIIVFGQNESTVNELDSKMTEKDEQLSAKSCSGNSAQDQERDTLNQLATELCRECREPLPDPDPCDMMLYLHALTYKGPDFEFSAPLPYWAEEHFKKTGSSLRP